MRGFHTLSAAGCLIGCHLQAVVTTVANDDVVSTWERDAVKVRVTHRRKIVITHLLSRHSRDSQLIVFFVLFLFLFSVFFLFGRLSWLAISSWAQRT